MLQTFTRTHHPSIWSSATGLVVWVAGPGRQQGLNQHRVSLHRRVAQRGPATAVVLGGSAEAVLKPRRLHILANHDMDHNHKTSNHNNITQQIIGGSPLPLSGLYGSSMENLWIMVYIWCLYCEYMDNLCIWLVVEPYPPKNMKVNWDEDIPNGQSQYMEKIKMFQSTNQIIWRCPNGGAPPTYHNDLF